MLGFYFNEQTTQQSSPFRAMIINYQYQSKLDAMSKTN